MVGDKGEGARTPGRGWRVAICEPDALTRRAIENIFDAAGFVVMSAPDIEDLEKRMPEKTKGSPPPVVVTDAACVKGWFADELLKRKRVGSVILMAEPEVALLERITRAKNPPCAVLLRSETDPDELPQIARLVGRGYSVTSPGITVVRTALAGREVLTGREKQIVKLVAQGLTNAQIAERLSMSMHTAKEHVAQILRKQGLRRRIDLAAWAHEHGVANGSSS
ncbi:MAG TPA: LuxR C-terminal-related transcriptional regulator [Candidatus Limnocylindria bacterium]|nr:LuxR C-terminal-related transcriptional regulator [Candidatus Limnocylindria bacterium]